MQKTSVVIAEPANAPAYYIFALTPMNNYNGLNDAYFQDLIYRPVYWIGDNGQAKVNNTISLADTPTYTDGGRCRSRGIANWTQHSEHSPSAAGWNL